MKEPLSLTDVDQNEELINEGVLISSIVHPKNKKKRHRKEEDKRFEERESDRGRCRGGLLLEMLSCMHGRYS